MKDYRTWWEKGEDVANGIDTVTRGASPLINSFNDGGLWEQLWAICVGLA